MMAEKSFSNWRTYAPARRNTSFRDVPPARTGLAAAAASAASASAAAVLLSCHIMRIMTSRSRLVLAVAVILLSTPAAAQQKLLTLDDIYDPVKRVSFSGTPPSNLTWIDAAHYVW